MHLVFLIYDSVIIVTFDDSLLTSLEACLTCPMSRSVTVSLSILFVVVVTVMKISVYSSRNRIFPQSLNADGGYWSAARGVGLTTALYWWVKPHVVHSLVKCNRRERCQRSLFNEWPSIGRYNDQRSAWAINQWSRCWLVATPRSLICIRWIASHDYLIGRNVPRRTGWSIKYK